MNTDPARRPAKRLPREPASRAIATRATGWKGKATTRSWQLGSGIEFGELIHPAEREGPFDDQRLLVQPSERFAISAGAKGRVGRIVARGRRVKREFEISCDLP